MIGTVKKKSSHTSTHERKWLIKRIITLFEIALLVFWTQMQTVFSGFIIQHTAYFSIKYVGGWPINSIEKVFHFSPFVFRVSCVFNSVISIQDWIVQSTNKLDLHCKVWLLKHKIPWCKLKTDTRVAVRCFKHYIMAVDYPCFKTIHLSSTFIKYLRSQLKD